MYYKLSDTLNVRFFRGVFSGRRGYHLFSMVSFFAYTCPNWSGVGAIDNPDRSEQVFDQYNIPEDPEKFSRTTFR